MRAALAIACAVAGAAEAGVAVPADPTPELNAYAATVKKAIAATWHPLDLLDDHVQGRDLGPWIVVVDVSIGSDGALTGVAVAHSSGLAAFDQAALDAFRIVPRFEPPPTTLIDPKTGAVTFPFTLMVPGWGPPSYLGDPDQRHADTGSWMVGSSVASERRQTMVAAGFAKLSRISVVAEAAYRVNPRILLELDVPFDTVRFREPGSASRDLTGFGDPTIHLHQLGRRGDWYFSGFLGASLPLGASEAMPVAGTAAQTIVQLGSGILQPELGGCMSHFIWTGARLGFCDLGRVAVYPNKYGFQDSYAFDARLFGDRAFLHRQLSTYFAVHFSQLTSAHLNGVPVPDSDVTTVSYELGAWFWIIRGLSIHAGFETSLYRSTPGSNAFDDLRLIGGLTWDFDLR